PRARRCRVERPPRRKERSMNDRTSFYPELAKKIAPADGRLAVLLPGLGAVSTTLIAGTHLIRKGLAKPFGSVTQMQKLRLGKRTRPRFTLVKDLVPLATLDALAFGGWDLFTDHASEAAGQGRGLTAGAAGPGRHRVPAGGARGE